jgi:hypothetical protein
MKFVKWTDSNGIKHLAGITDNIPEKMPHLGYQFDPPDVFNINWQDVAKDLHNQLVDRGLFTYEDIQRYQNRLAGAILASLRKRVKRLYKENKV